MKQTDNGVKKALRDLTDLRQAEETFKSLVSSSPIGIFIAANGRFKLVNPGFQKITGFSEQELFRKGPLSLVAPEFKKIARENSDRVLEGKGIPPFEFQFIDKQGKNRWAMATLTPTQYQGKGGVLGYFMETTERKLLENQLFLAQKMEAVGRLAGGLAHDFSNIAAVIIWSVQQMMKDIDEAHPAYQYLNEVRISADRAILLSRQLLGFSRKQILQPKIINLNEVIADLQHMIRRLVGEDIELITELEPTLKAVKADPARMEQVIMNLVVNARDAMPEGGKLIIETGNVYLDPSYAQEHFEVIPGPYVMLAVSDNGLGMDRETKNHIFEPFYTTKEPDKGTGLGLSTVYAIVKQSGGNVEVYSEPGVGTTLKIYLPQVEEELAAAEPRISEVVQLKGSETILLVEDEKMLLNLMAKTLREHGYTVLSAQDGREALRLSEQYPGPIHLILTDMVTPQVTGRQLTERLCSARPETRVLYMSGYTEKATAEHGDAGGGQFIQKPFTAAALVRMVREVLDASPDK